jgi:hypothetical protein
MSTTLIDSRKKEIRNLERLLEDIDNLNFTSGLRKETLQEIHTKANARIEQCARLIESMSNKALG